MTDKNYKAKPYRIDTNTKKLPITGGRQIKTKASIGVILKLLGDSIYHSDASALREQLTNAISHGCMPINKKEPNKAYVDLNINFQDRTIVVTDTNGIGIPFDDMDKIVTEMGTSGNHDRTRSGQHGLGLFSFLRLSTTAILETWSKVTDERYAFICEGGETWDEIGNRELTTTGTRIEITCKDKVDLMAMVKSVKDVCEFQEVRTVLTVEGAPSENTANVSNYGLDDENWYHGDDVYEFGQVDFEEQCLKNSSVVKVVKLKGKDMDIYLGIGNRDRTNHSNRTNNQLLLCNVPVTNTISNFDCPQIWVNLTSEKRYKPPVDRDSMHAETMTVVQNEIHDAVKKWVEGINVETVQDYEIHEHASLILNNNNLDKWLPEKTLNLFHALRTSFRVWGTKFVDDGDNGNIIRPVNKDVWMKLGEIIKNNTMIVNTWNTNYYEAFRDYYNSKKQTFLLVKPKPSGVRERQVIDHDRDVKILETYFKYAKDVRKELKIKLTTNKSTKEVADSSVKEVNVREFNGSYGYESEKLPISDLDKSILKLESVSWNYLKSQISIYGYSGEGEHFRKAFSGILANRTYEKLTKEKCCTEQELGKEAMKLDFTVYEDGKFKKIKGSEIINKYESVHDNAGRSSITVGYVNDKELLKYVDRLKEKPSLVIFDDSREITYPGGEGIESTTMNLVILKTALTLDMVIHRAIEDNQKNQDTKQLYGINWGVTYTPRWQSLSSELNLVRLKERFPETKQLPRVGQVPAVLLDEITNYLENNNIDENYHRLFTYITLAIYSKRRLPNFLGGEVDTDSRNPLHIKGMWNRRQTLEPTEKEILDFNSANDFQQNVAPFLKESNKFVPKMISQMKQYGSFESYGNELIKLLETILKPRFESPNGKYVDSYYNSRSYWSTSMRPKGMVASRKFYTLDDIDCCNCGVGVEHSPNCSAFKELPTSWDDGKIPITSNFSQNVYCYTYFKDPRNSISAYDENAYQLTHEESGEAFDYLSIEFRRYQECLYRRDDTPEKIDELKSSGRLTSHYILTPINIWRRKNESFNGNYDETNERQNITKVFSSEDWQFISYLINYYYTLQFENKHTDSSNHIVTPEALAENFGTRKTKVEIDWHREIGKNCYRLIWNDDNAYDVEVDLNGMQSHDLERIIWQKGKSTEKNLDIELKEKKLIIKGFKVD